MSEPSPDVPYWSRDIAELSADFRSGHRGMASQNAAEQLRLIGPNSIEDAQRLGALRLLLRQFESPLVLILIFAAVVSLVLRQWVDASIILAIVLGSTLLGFYQEYRASAAVEELKRRLALTCRVVRDGLEKTVPASAIVPGDVIVLSAGNLIPADGRVIESEDFLVNEASLTGESFPVEKRPGTVPPETPIAGRTNAVYLGTSAQSGTAKVLAVNTGRGTAFGAIAARIKARPPETEFGRGIRQFGYLLIRVMVVIVLFVLTVNQLLGRPWIESLLFAVALAVGLSPELLPAIISVTLAAGARAMAKQGVIVRRLDAIENLGSMDIFCTDKTGTLTEGAVALQDATDAEGRSSADVRQLAFLNAAFETGIDNPLDAAIIAIGESSGLTTGGYRKIDEIPYDFLRKRLTIVVAADADPAWHQIVTKGAFANVLAICHSVAQDGVDVPIATVRQAELDAFYQAKSAEGFRVLAVATRKVAARDHYVHGDESAMVFAGFLLFSDPPKSDAQQTISDLLKLGIRIKVISGDNRYVTGHLAKAVGLDPKSMITGEQMAKLKDEALWHLAPHTDLFVEVDPQQKERVVRALQRTGHAVGYLGDGINDAPALHAADVGISVEQAVDVARESADIILLNRNLDVLRRGVEDGRRTFANTLKYICITTSANFGNMVSMALAAPLLPFLPLAAKQILLNNFLSDVPSIAISTDNVDPETVTRPQRWKIRDVRHFMIVFGLVSSAFDLLTFAILLLVFHADEATFQTTWFIISLLTELAVVLVLRTHRPAFRSIPSRVLMWTTVVVSLAALSIPFLGSLASAFGFVRLSTLEMGSVLVILAGYIAATEGAKAWFYRRHETPLKGAGRHPPALAKGSPAQRIRR
ncbi:magnesium-translocating P-type ATPase [Inquilinus sp. OTU3971]|uniref:magnesium-translocating P-type ATPase n=1 Tax=Inquilinus sp. OTU3971 TaxID=3043855 RepID=UPI00313AB134